MIIVSKLQTTSAMGRKYVNVLLEVPAHEDGRKPYSLRIDPRDITPDFLAELASIAEAARIEQNECIEKARQERWLREAAKTQEAPPRRTGKTERKRAAKQVRGQ